MVHLSEFRGPLPETGEGKEEESSESTLTEANNGMIKPNPAQIYDILRPDPYPGFNNVANFQGSSNVVPASYSAGTPAARTTTTASVAGAPRQDTKWSHVAEPGELKSTVRSSLTIFVNDVNSVVSHSNGFQE